MSKKSTSPIALILHPHPQYGGTMNKKVIVDTFHAFVDNGFSMKICEPELIQEFAIDIWDSGNVHIIEKSAFKESALSKS